MAKRVKAAAAPSKVQTTDDLVSALARMTELQAQRDQAMSEVETQFAVINQGLELVLTTVKAEEAALAADIQRYAEVHRAALTENGKVKTATFATGDVGWRNDPPSVSVPRDQAAQVAIIDALAAIDEGLVRTLRVIDKEAILALQREVLRTPGHEVRFVDLALKFQAVERIEGVKIRSEVEKFFIRPKGIAEPEHAGAPADAVAEAVAA